MWWTVPSASFTSSTPSRILGIKFWDSLGSRLKVPNHQAQVPLEDRFDGLGLGPARRYCAMPSAPSMRDGFLVGRRPPTKSARSARKSHVPCRSGLFAPNRYTPPHCHGTLSPKTRHDPNYASLLEQIMPQSRGGSSKFFVKYAAGKPGGLLRGAAQRCLA